MLGMYSSSVQYVVYLDIKNIGRIFMKFGILSILRKSVDKIQTFIKIGKE